VLVANYTAWWQLHMCVIGVHRAIVTNESQTRDLL